MNYKSLLFEVQQRIEEDNISFDMFCEEKNLNAKQSKRLFILLLTNYAH